MYWRTKFTQFLDRLISIGVDPEFGEEFNDRLKIQNIFTWTCILFAAPYYATMVFLGNYFAALLFLTIQILFSLSLLFNKLAYFNVGKFMILISTNYAVLTLNFTFGYESGFYLYYFTAPLIVFSFFYFHQWLQTVITLALYLSSYVITEIAHYKNVDPFVVLEDSVVSFLYYINVVLSFCFLIVLARSFSKFHKNASEQVRKKNVEMNQNQLVLERLLNDKNTLLSETHHRVKNNLAVICGMFDLQMMHESNPKIKSVFLNSKNRIKSMSLIHESLYSQANVSQIDFKSYIQTLIAELELSLQSKKHVNFSIDIDNISLDLSRAIPCGLIINEIITNSFKHAFETINYPEIFIKMKRADNYRLSIGDNGIGLNQNILAAKNSIGMSLIDALTQQLDGSLQIKNKVGTHFILTFD